MPDVERALALIANAPPVLRRSVFELIEDETGGGIELRTCLANKVKFIDLSASATPSIGDCELHVWSGELQSIVWPTECEIDIIDFEPHEDGKGLRLVASLPLHLVVQVPVEISFSLWDGIDKESVPMGGRTVEVDQEIDVEATITFDVYSQGTEDQEFVFEDAEIDAKDFEVDLGEEL